MADLNEEKDQDPAPKKEVDFDAILLPKTDNAPSLASAQRVGAGTLLAQEQAATLLTPEGKAQPAAHTPAPKAPLPPAPPAPPVPSEIAINPLQTYKGDIEKVINKDGASVVSIAAAEADRRAQGSRDAQPVVVEMARTWGLTAALVLGGLVLVAVAVFALYHVIKGPNTVEPGAQAHAPFIAVDSVAPFVFETKITRELLMQRLTAARNDTNLSVGLIEWLYPARSSDGGATLQPLPLAEILATLAPRVPQTLLRTITRIYLLGVHSFDENQAFLIFDVDAYETAYRGMLDWEYTIGTDLSPLFTRSPSPRAQGAVSLEGPEPFLQTGFVDKIVENRDVRALLNEEGDLVLLWTMLGRNTVVIATNEYTLREIVARMQTAPVVPQPGS